MAATASCGAGTSHRSNPAWWAAEERSAPMPRGRSLLPVLVGCLAVLGTAGEGCAQSADKVQLQLRWVPQAQFAGYYAARAKGVYAAEKLDVTIRPGGQTWSPRRSWWAAARSLGSAGSRASSPRGTGARLS